MGINVQTKGKEGEREVARLLNNIIKSVLTKHGLPIPEKDIVQRNQNQSAVGGSDLSNTFGVAIEVKRQETLSINTWWKQCETEANTNNEIPVLIFRQNGKKWRVVLYCELRLPGDHSSVRTRCEIDIEGFLAWFYHWVDRKVSEGERPRV